MITNTMPRLLLWTPRILCILFALSISIFAADVFGEGYDVWHTILALLIHLIPTFVILAVLIASWRWPWVGGIVYIALGVFYMYWFWGKFNWMAYTFIAGPLFITGILFLISWRNLPAPQKVRR
ncbi:MAG: hypothetical protein NTV22_18065 [bacterium]|nr:hypothetical protein [bacterium]